MNVNRLSDLIVPGSVTFDLCHDLCKLVADVLLFVFILWVTLFSVYKILKLYIIFSQFID